MAAAMCRGTPAAFAPAMIARALPDAWSMANRQEILDVRLGIARDRVVEAIGDQDVTRTADATQRLVEQLDLAGRPLAAAHASIHQRQFNLLAS